MDDNTYSCMFPTWQVLPDSMTFLKTTKRTPLQPIVSSSDSVTYGVAKELVAILQPLVGNTPHHIHNTQNLVESIKDITLHPGKCITFYNFSALFISVPMEPTLDIIKNRLQKDHTLSQNSPHSTSQNSWGFAFTAPISSSKISIINRLRVQPWDPQVVL